MEVKNKDEEVKALDNAYLDVVGDWQPTLDALVELMAKLKVPKKNKGK